MDEAYPQPQLFSLDPLQKALDKILIEHFANVVNAVYPVMTCNPKAPPDALKNFENALDVFEQELIKRGTPYFGGQKIGIVDYMIWPWFERFPSLKYNTEQHYELDAKRYEQLVSRTHSDSLYPNNLSCSCTPTAQVAPVGGTGCSCKGNRTG